MSSLEISRNPENPYNQAYTSLPNNIKAYVDKFRSDHDRINNIDDLIIIYEKYPLPNVPDIIQYAKNIEYDIMYKVHIQILAKCLDSAPGLFKGIMEVIS